MRNGYVPARPAHTTRTAARAGALAGGWHALVTSVTSVTSVTRTLLGPPHGWPPARGGVSTSASTPVGASRAVPGETRATQARGMGGVAAAATRRGDGSDRKRACAGARGRSARTSWGSCGSQRRGRRRRRWRWRRGRRGRPSRPCHRRPSRAAQWYLRRAEGAASERRRRRERAHRASS